MKSLGEDIGTMLFTNFYGHHFNFDCFSLLPLTLIYICFPMMFGFLIDVTFLEFSVSIPYTALFIFTVVFGWLTYSAFAGAYYAKKLRKEDEDIAIIAKLEEL